MKRALLAAVLLAGCAMGPTAADCGVSKGAADGLSAPGGHPVAIHALHDERPNRDVAFCARLDAHGAFGKVVEGSNAVPNVALLANGTYASARATIDAWIAGREPHARLDVDLARTPHVVLALQGNGTLRIDAFEQPPVFS